MVKACKDIDAEILVVDNASEDNSRVYLSGRFADVQFFWNTSNVGFSKANNLMLEKTSGEYILFLNPDTIIPEDCFTKCIAFLQQHSNAGALGVHMIDGSGRFLRESKRGTPTAAGSLFKLIGLCTLFPRSKYFSQYYAGHLPEYAINKTGILSGAFIMMTRRAAAITNGFDESFFMYGEDIDLCKRINDAGLDNYYFPETTVIHFKGESTLRRSPKYIKRFYGAMKQYARKHYQQKKLKLFFMNAAISAATLASRAKIKLAKEKNERAELSHTCIIAGTEAAADSVRRNFHEFSNASISVSATAAETDIFSSHIDSFVFCNEARSTKENIRTLMILPGNTNALFYSSGAHSIIGSTQKHTRGVVITMSE